MLTLFLILIVVIGIFLLVTIAVYLITSTIWCIRELIEIYERVGDHTQKPEKPCKNGHLTLVRTKNVVHQSDHIA
jgi:hypothetical protein